MFVLIYMLSFTKNYLPYIDYTVNFKFISTNLCINKDTNLFCQGTCYLNRELKKATEAERDYAASLPAFVQAELLTDIGEMHFSVPFTYLNSLNYPPVKECWLQIIPKHQTPPPKS